MNAYIVAAALIIKAAQADFAGDASLVASAANHLSSEVSAWQKTDAAGAASIQMYFPTLQSAVSSLSGDIGSLNDNLDIDSVTSFGDSVVGVLNALSSRASDFEGAGINKLVAQDVSNINGPAGDIVNGIIKAVQNDCGKVQSLTSILAKVENGFNSVASAYSVSAPSIDAPPSSCLSSGAGAAAASSGSASGSSAAASSSPAPSSSQSKSSSAASSSSAAAAGASKSASSSETKSSAAASSSAAPSSSAVSSSAASSSAASSSAASSSAASSSAASSSVSSSSADVKNSAAQAVSVGVSGAVLGAIALLI